MIKPGIRIHDLTVAYGRHPAVHHLDGEFRSGSLTAIVGPNGAGKSTLIRAMVGQLPVATGRVELDGFAARDLGYLPQAAEIDRSFPLTVADVVLLGAWRRLGGWLGVDRATADQARDALAGVGLEGFERRHIGSLSAGQFQRVQFARLLLQDAPVILLDEPFTAIDERTTRELLQLVGRWHGERRTVIAVLHELDQVRAHFPDTLLLAREPVAWGPTDSALAPANLLRARAMAERFDDQAAICQSRRRRPEA